MLQQHTFIPQTHHAHSTPKEIKLNIQINRENTPFSSFAEMIISEYHLATGTAWNILERPRVISDKAHSLLPSNSKVEDIENR